MQQLAFRILMTKLKIIESTQLQMYTGKMILTITNDYLNSTNKIPLGKTDNGAKSKSTIILNKIK